MAANRDSISNIGDTIEGSFDVDVVGLTDLVEFRSDGELFDFESGGEFGLFGEDGVPLHQTSSYATVSSGEKEALTNGSSFHPSSRAEKGLRTSPKLSKKPRKTKVWNEMEKDLFLKGLELFGENWRKISKFIATKTINQVKFHHKQWAETANVIPDSVNLANDSSIYLPLANTDDRYFTTGYNDSLGFIENGACKPLSVTAESGDPNVSTDTRASGSERDTEFPGMNFGEGIVFSSLHDWNLGSQVSVTEEDSPVKSPLTSGPLNIICEKKTTIKKKPGKRRNQRRNISKRKKLHVKMKRKAMKRLSFQSTKTKLKTSSQNIIGAPKSIAINEGQIIRLNKNESEDSDVNIDESDDDDDDDDDDDSHLFLIDKPNTSKTGSVVNLSKKVTENKNKSLIKTKISDDTTIKEYEFENLLEEEKLIYSDVFESKDEMTLAKFISVRDQIIGEWEKCKPSILTKNQISTELKPLNSKLIHKIYDHLETNGFINSSSNFNRLNGSRVKKRSPLRRVLPRRKRNRPAKELFTDKLRSDIIKKGGGVTMSHDASGAVIDALHIPESASNNHSNELKKNSTLKPFTLLNCLTHDPNTPAPFTSVLYPQAVITLDLHSHSSFSEVIGLLGGFLDKSTRTLHITVAMPTDASSSGFDCEMCPVSQTKAFEMIRESGMEMVGWYHSHPTFPPNPSQRDLDTQTQLQNWFKKSDAPFLGLIISPYCPSANSESSVIRCFILDSPPSQHADDLKEFFDTEVPYRLRWEVQNNSQLEWEEIERMVEDILQKSKDHPNPINWNDEWKNGLSYLDKFIASLKSLIPFNVKELVNFIEDFIIESRKT